MDISGKTAIVTGAASGIGLGIATALAEAGANVVMADIQKDAVEAAAHGLSGTNKRVMPVRIGVTIWGVIHSIRHFLPAILKHGKKGTSSTPPRSPASRTAAAPNRGRIR